MTAPKLHIVRDTSSNEPTEPISDEMLIRRCQEGDRHAFELLVRRHQRTIYALLYRLAPDWNDLSDLSQEVFIRMWRNIGRLKNPKAFRSWITQIATHLFYDELRKRPRQLPLLSMDEPIETDEGDGGTRDIPDRSANPDELCQRRELAQTVRAAMSQLPEQFRTAIVLRELQGLSYEEIATLTNSELGTVKSRIARARGKVQELLTPYLQDAA